MNIFLSVIASILLLGMIVEKETYNKIHYTICFCIVAIGIILINLIPKII